MSDLADALVWEEERGEEMEWSRADQAGGSLRRILEEGQVGREEPLSENTAGFGD